MSERPINYDKKSFRVRESKARSLVYSKEIKDFVHDNPTVLNRTCALIDQILESKGEVDQLEDKDIKVEVFFDPVLEEYYETDDVEYNHFRVQVGDKTFFVKRFSGSAPTQGGYKEVMDAREAMTRVAELEGVKIIKYHLGYTSKHQNYVVSGFVDESVVRLYDYFDQLKKDSSKKQELEILTSRYKEVQTLLHDYIDMTSIEREDVSNNIFYDPNTKEIILFDLNLGEDSKDAN